MRTGREVMATTPGLTRSRYEKQLILRLVQVCDSIIAEAPDLADVTNFERLWSAAIRVSPLGLVRASRQPLLDAWISTAERLVRYGIHKSYPEAHPARHLKNFARVVLSWAPYLPDYTRGEIRIVGQQVFQLLHGELLLIGGDRNADETLLWEVKGGTLRAGTKSNDALLVMNLSDSTETFLSDENWEVVRVPKLRSILIDTWTPEYHRNHAFSADQVSLERELVEICGQLPEDALALVTTLCSCVTRLPRSVQTQQDGESDVLPWIAGLLRMPAKRFEMRTLVESACRDLVERMLTVSPLALEPPSPDSDFRSLLIQVSAERLASRLLTGTSQPLGQTDGAQHWLGLIARLRQSGEGLAFLAQLGEDTETLIPAGIPVHNEVEKAPPAIPVPFLESLNIPATPAIRKTRKASAFSVDDFSILGVVGEVDPHELERVLPLLMTGSRESETYAFNAAAVAYCLGHFELCVAALARCLEFDADVEEYWHLLAFALRYLGQRDEFNKIVFAGVRDKRLIERLHNNSEITPR